MFKKLNVYVVAVMVIIFGGCFSQKSVYKENEVITNQESCIESTIDVESNVKRGTVTSEYYPEFSSGKTTIKEYYNNASTKTKKEVITIGNVYTTTENVNYSYKNNLPALISSETVTITKKSKMITKKEIVFYQKNGRITSAAIKKVTDFYKLTEIKDSEGNVIETIVSPSAIKSTLYSGRLVYSYPEKNIIEVEWFNNEYKVEKKRITLGNYNNIVKLISTNEGGGYTLDYLYNSERRLVEIACTGIDNVTEKSTNIVYDNYGRIISYPWMVIKYSDKIRYNCNQILFFNETYDFTI